MEKKAKQNKNGDIRSMFTKEKTTKETKEKEEEKAPKLITNFFLGNKTEDRGFDDFKEDEVRIWAWNINGLRSSITKEYLLNFLKNSKLIL